MKTQLFLDLKIELKNSFENINLPNEVICIAEECYLVYEICSKDQFHATLLLLTKP